MERDFEKCNIKIIGHYICPLTYILYYRNLTFFCGLLKISLYFCQKYFLLREMYLFSTKKILLSIVLILLSLPELKGQYAYNKRFKSIGTVFLAGGPAYCLGDAFGSPYNKNFLNSGNNWTISTGFRHLFPSNFGYRVVMKCGNYTGSDTDSKWHSNILDRVGCFSFESNTLGITLRGEYSVFLGNEYSQRKSSLYGFIGTGYLSNSANYSFINSGPKVQETLNKTIYFVPFGMGYQYQLNDQFSIGGELGWEYLFSDYGDGYSPKPPASKSNDILVGFSFVVGYKVFPDSRGY